MKIKCCKLLLHISKEYWQSKNRCWLSSEFCIHRGQNRGQIDGEREWVGSFLWRVCEQLSDPNIITEIMIFIFLGQLVCHKFLCNLLSIGEDEFNCLNNDFTKDTPEACKDPDLQSCLSTILFPSNSSYRFWKSSISSSFRNILKLIDHDKVGFWIFLGSPSWKLEN